ncbi:MAG: twin-arginine translocase subunit TatC [Caldimicrobium sp.]
MKKLNLPNIFEINLLGRLRRELIIYLILLFSLWLSIFFLFPKIFPFLLYPYFGLLSEKSLVFISLEEALFVVLRASFYIALALTLPFLIFRVYKAISSELYYYESKFLLRLLILSLLFAGLGILFGYFILTPFFLKVFLYFGQNFVNNLRVSAFMFFALKIVLFSVIIFQFPIFFALLIKEEIITQELYKQRRIYFLGTFYLLSLIFSPQDFLGQVLLTFFFFIIFKLSFLIAKLL